MSKQKMTTQTLIIIMTILLKRSKSELKKMCTWVMGDTYSITALTIERECVSHPQLFFPSCLSQPDSHSGRFKQLRTNNWVWDRQSLSMVSAVMLDVIGERSSLWGELEKSLLSRLVDKIIGMTWGQIFRFIPYTSSRLFFFLFWDVDL